MTKHNGELVRSAREHVFGLFRCAPEHVHVGHDRFPRTCDVVRACKEIAKGSNLPDADREVALLCAWFHDACHATGGGDDATARSLELCLQFLEQQHAHHPTREEIVACFRGAERPARPPSEAPEAPGGPDAPPLAATAPCDVLHDARLAALASEDYLDDAELLRLEHERSSGEKLTDLEWAQRCIAFFEAHPYRTRFAQEAYGRRRAMNLVRLQKLVRRRQRQLEERAGESNANQIRKITESVYYHFSRVHISLVGLADHRTSTMIHVNAIMLSLVIALLARKIETNRELLIPTVMLLIVNISVVFLSMYSMRATRPKGLSEHDARLHDSNILTVLNDTTISLAEFSERMARLMADPAELRRTVIEQLYFGRQVLSERARKLRLTYDVFIYGVILATIAFVIALARG